MARLGTSTSATSGVPADAWSRNMGLKQRSIKDEEDNATRVAGQMGDPMHGLAVSNAQQSLLNARTDVNGMATVLQGIKEAGGGRGAKVGFAPDKMDQPSALSPASWNPAGMTQEAAQADAKRFAAGGPLPEWYKGATPETQDAFRRRVLQGIKGAKG